MSEIRTESLRTRRTALVAMRGPEGDALLGVPEVWYVLHGYSMRAVPFLADCGALDDGSRLIVAPEALSRFYEGDLTAHRNAPVGASWMTREERASEITDYLDYLDDVHAMVTARLGGATPAVTVLGFSQGGATAARWVASGRVAAHRLIVWGSSMAPEIDLVAEGSPIRRTETVFVVGAADIYITKKVVETETGRLRAANFPFRLLSFDGGHRLDDNTLREIATAR